MLFELVLPCYNESKSIAHLIERAKQAAQAAGLTANDFRLVLVENGSKDDSRAVMQSLAQGPLGEWFRMVPVDLNQGYGFGLWSGLKACTADFVGWSHADQQCDPKDAFLALHTLREIRDPKIFIKGVRRGRALRDRFVSRVFEIFARVLLGFGIYEINAQPKVFARALLNEIQNPPKTFAFDLYVLFRARKAGYRMKTIPVLFPPRIHGVSNWAGHWMSRYKTILGMIKYMWDLAKTEGRV